MIRPFLALAAALALAIMTAPMTAAAQTEAKPMAAGGLIIRNSSGGSTVGHALAEGTTDREGRFSIRARLEPGLDYEITMPCRARTPCAPFQLRGLTVNGRPVRPVEAPRETRGDRNGVGIYIIGAVALGLREPTTVVLAGQVTEGPVADAGPAPQGLSPYAGIDIMFGGSKLTRVVGTTGRDGRFSGRVEIAPGEYEVTAACPPRAACPPFRLTSVRVDGRTISPDARGRFVVVVRPGRPPMLVEANSALQEVSTTR